MGSRYQFEIMTETEALDVLDMSTRQSEFYPDRLRAVRRFRMVASVAETAAAKAFVSAPTVGCTSCGRFAFAVPMLCFWCLRST